MSIENLNSPREQTPEVSDSINENVESPTFDSRVGPTDNSTKRDDVFSHDELPKYPDWIDDFDRRVEPGGLILPEEDDVLDFDDRIHPVNHEPLLERTNDNDSDLENQQSGIDSNDSSSSNDVVTDPDIDNNPIDIQHKSDEVHGDEPVETIGQVKNSTEESSRLDTTSPKKYYDDNGNLYREGDNLIPNNEYEINGYKYKTDNDGRIISAEGKLQIKDHPGRKEMDPRSTVNKGDMEDSDQRGHLIADQFNGSGGIENVVAMDGKLNQGDYAKLENKLADAVKSGADVKYKVEPVYKDNSTRPSEFKVSYSINGEKTVTVFKNGSETKK
ncbi:MAG: DNA/RNA non-specific endonuclease [Saccharofermentans sp.]|nr:DNA/RNA non-specific endonuclease [Saccharofermentans sp.]